MSREILVFSALSMLIIIIILIKLKLVSSEYFQLFFNVIFFSYIFLCLHNDYVDITRGGVILYTGVGLISWIKEILDKNDH